MRYLDWVVQAVWSSSSRIPHTVSMKQVGRCWIRKREEETQNLPFMQDNFNVYCDVGYTRSRSTQDNWQVLCVPAFTFQLKKMEMTHHYRTLPQYLKPDKRVCQHAYDHHIRFGLLSFFLQFTPLLYSFTSSFTTQSCLLILSIVSLQPLLVVKRLVVLSNTLLVSMPFIFSAVVLPRKLFNVGTISRAISVMLASSSAFSSKLNLQILLSRAWAFKMKWCVPPVYLSRLACSSTMVLKHSCWYVGWG